MKRIILFFHHYTNGLKSAWKNCGFQVIERDDSVPAQGMEGVLTEVTKYCKEYGIQVVFTFDFSPDLAEVCHRLHLFYVSWIVDCPHAALWSYEAKYMTNYIFEFDYAQYQKLRNRNHQNVWYLPLSTDTESFEAVIKQDERKSKILYQSDVAFVGNLYSDEEHSLYDSITYLPPWLEGYLDALISAQRKIWGADLLGESISEEAWSLLRQYVKWNLGDRYDAEVYEVCVTNMIAQKVAQLERKEVCSYLAHHFDFALYTGGDTSFDPVIVNKGYANYLTKMPLIFHYCKINIHITVRSITSAIPLRVLDVLACEGFLLTNYQPEIVEYFADGEELVIYSDFQDMYQKIVYYLAHEEERKKIAHAGYLKVKEYFNYTRGIEQIVSVLQEEAWEK